MKHNKLITEELRAITALMSYDRSKTLSENIQEQGSADIFVDQRAMSLAGIDYSDYKKQQWEKQNESFEKLIEFFSDPHNVLMAVELGSMFIAPFTGPFAPVFLGISIGAGLADSAVYYFIDGDPHSAMMALALTIVPEAKLGKYFRRSKGFIDKYGRKGADEVLERYNKYKNGNTSIKFTDEEMKFLKESGEDLAEKATQEYLKSETANTIKKGLLKTASEKTVKGLLSLIVNTLKFTGKTIKSIGSTGIMLGGTYYIFDQIYLSIWGDDEDRQKSEFKQIADLVTKFSGDVMTWLTSIYNELINGIDFEDKDISKDYNNTILPKNEPILSAQEYDETKNRASKERRANLPGKKVTLDGIRSGKESLHYGDQGNSVEQIQQMLINLGLDVGDKGADGFFGDDTKEAVKEFQRYPDSYGLVNIVGLDKVDGIVGRETLTAIEKALKIKKNG
jgi:predicted nucleotidyltransferase